MTRDIVLGKTLHNASFHPGVQMDTGEETILTILKPFWPLNGSEAGVTYSLTAIQWPGHQEDNCKMVCLMLGVILQWTNIPSKEGAEIFPVASWNRNKDKLCPDWPHGLYAELTFT